MNEIGNHYNMQQLMDLMGQQTQNVNSVAKDVRTLAGEVGNLSKTIEEVKGDVSIMKGDIETMKYREEITYEQQNAIDNAVSKAVYSLIGVSGNPSKWTLEERTVNQKYGKLFRKRLRMEVSNKGHLAYPYRTTKKGNFIDAIRDIESWTPRNGITGLMKEADDNALARKIAREQGY